MIDTHCHLDFRQYDQDRPQVIDRSLEELSTLINVGAGLQASRDVLGLSADHECVYVTAGLHPQNTEPGLTLSWEEQLTALREIVKVNRIAPDQEQSGGQGGKLVAVGECGLDYSPAPPGEEDRPKSEQREIFASQIELAQEFSLPLVVHSRDALGDTLSVLGEFDYQQVVFHCFTYGPERAREVLDCGFMISFTGIVTFQKAKSVQGAAAYVPLERLMVETDAPFLAPVPYRGKRCEPWMVKYVAEKIAQLKGVNLEEVEDKTDENARKFFGLR